MHHELGATGLELVEERQQAALKIGSTQQIETAKVVGAAGSSIVRAGVRREA